MSKKARARFIFFVFASFTLALIISIIYGACFFISLRTFKKDDTVERYKLYSGYVDASKTTKNVYSEDIIRGGVMCLDFSDIAEFCAFTVIGDGDDITFYFNNSDKDILEITVGQTVAYVNGNPISMPAAAYMIDDDIYLPVEFVSRYIDGVTFTSDDEKETIKIEYSDMAECSLRLKAPSSTPPIDPDTWTDPKPRT